MYILIFIVKILKNVLRFQNAYKFYTKCYKYRLYLDKATIITLVVKILLFNWVTLKLSHTKHIRISRYKLNIKKNQASS